MGETITLEDFGCVVWLNENTIFSAEIGEFELHGTDPYYAVEVTAPDSQYFLDSVNAHFDTEFYLDHFAGR